jgi:hypothetical protein
VACSRSANNRRFSGDHTRRKGNGRFTAALGAEPRTPLDVAVRNTLTGLGCLSDRQ